MAFTPAAWVSPFLPMSPYYAGGVTRRSHALNKKMLSAEKNIHYRVWWSKLRFNNKTRQECSAKEV
jgi:hypothetical protein